MALFGGALLSPVLGTGVSGMPLAAMKAPRGRLPLPLLRRMQCFEVSGLSWPQKSRGTFQGELLPELLPKMCQLVDTNLPQNALRAKDNGTATSVGTSLDPMSSGTCPTRPRARGEMEKGHGRRETSNGEREIPLCLVHGWEGEEQGQ